MANSFRVGDLHCLQHVLMLSLGAVPTTEKWRSIAERFKERWDFPLCCGALDGKQVILKAPDNSGSQFYNYKGTFSLVLTAVVEAQYCFWVMDVGSYA